jgi:hypothetical protein
MEPSALAHDELIARLTAGMAFREHVGATIGVEIPAVRDGDALRALAARCADTSVLEREHGWRIEPPFPGFGEPPQKMGEHWRMVCAARLYRGSEEIGTVFTTLVTGRPPAVVVNPPKAEIPANYTPIVRR